AGFRNGNTAGGPGRRSKVCIRLKRNHPRICEGQVRHRAERGMSLFELMIAMVVLATGLGGITILLTGSIASNSRNNRDTTATLLAQMVISQISGQHVYSVGTITMTDCAGTNWTIATTPGAV